MMELSIEGEPFRVEVEGADDKLALLLSPSLGTDLSLFDAQMRALLPHFRVVRYDPRGHGGSTTAGAPYSLERLGRDALAILDALDIETTHFIGLSMGGAVGQWLLVNAPERIGRAVIANTAARLGNPEIWNTRIATVIAGGTQTLVEPTMERWFSAAFRVKGREHVAAVEAIFSGTSSDGYAGACAALRDMDLREAIRRIDRPVLVVSGRDDPVTSVADIAALTGSIRGARHVELDCRHISNIEQAEAFNAAVVAFLTAPMTARSSRKPPAPRRASAQRATTARSPLKPAATGAATKRAAPRKTPVKTTRRASGAVTTAASAKPSAAESAGGKAVAKKTAVKKASSGTSAAKKTARKPAARRKTTSTTARTSPRKTPSKVATKKAPAKKATGRKTPAKKPASRRPASTRRPSLKRPGRPGGRKR